MKYAFLLSFQGEKGLRYFRVVSWYSFKYEQWKQMSLHLCISGFIEFDFKGNKQIWNILLQHI